MTMRGTMLAGPGAVGDTMDQMTLTAAVVGGRMEVSAGVGVAMVQVARARARSLSLSVCVCVCVCVSLSLLDSARLHGWWSHGVLWLTPPGSTDTMLR